MRLPTKILTPEEWPLVAETVRSQFRDAMPVTPDQSSFLAAFDGPAVAGFVQIETLLHLNNLHVAPKYRDARLAWQLLREAVALTPKGYSVVALTDLNEVAKLAVRLGGRDLGRWQLIRKDC